MKKLLLVLLTPLLFIGLSGRAHASTQDFVIDKFDADYTLSNQNKHGSMHIVETINLTYNDFNHGIYRAIPNSYKKHSLQVSVNSITSTTSAPTQYTSSKTTGNLILKIGDPNKTITGPQQYTIDYTVQNVISYYPDHDELYWDINGDQWQQIAQQVTVRVHLPDGLKVLDKSGLNCFTGRYGSNAMDCSILNVYPTVTSETVKPMGPNETLTIVVGFEKGYFAPFSTTENTVEAVKKFAPLVLFPTIFGSYAFLRWRRYGRDPKGAGTIVPEYQPPTDISPLEVGTLLNFKSDNKGISASLIDLAVRGYIKIIEQKKDRLIGKDKLVYTLELVKNDFSQLSPNEMSLIRGIFSDKSNYVVGSQVPISALANKFYTTATVIKSRANKDMVEKGYIAKSTLLSGGLLNIMGIALIVVGLFFGWILGFTWVTGMNIAGILCIIFGVYMPARTKAGVEAKDKINGLKLYLNTAEKDRIAMLQAPNAPYGANHDAPIKTVDLFEKLLPYAMVLGVEEKWASQFSDIYKTPPDWYSGNWTAFNTGLFIGSLNNSVTAMNTVAFSVPSSSGSSGMGGGGFSGGGGGGGGGGGW